MTVVARVAGRYLVVLAAFTAACAAQTVDLGGPPGADAGVVGPDAAPPDDHGDTFATGTAIVDGTAVDGAIEVAGDQDWFVFAPVADRIYALATAGQASLDATVFATDATSELARGADLRWKARDAATVGIRVTRAGGATGLYTMQVTGIGADDFVDSAAAATPGFDLLTSFLILGEIQFPGDQDWVSFEVTAGRRYDLEFESDVAVYLMCAEDGTPLVVAADRTVTAITDRMLVRVDTGDDAMGPYSFRVNEYP